ncbi:hypothetical protein RB195_014164 [Necator americanus]
MTGSLNTFTKRAQSFKTTKRRLSLETLELIRNRGSREPRTHIRARKALQRGDKERPRREKSRCAGCSCRTGEKHPLCPSRLRQSQDEDDCSPEPKGNSHCIEKGDGENHLRLLL